MRAILAVSRCSAVIALAMLCWFVRSATAHQRTVISGFAQGHLYRHGVVPMLGRHSASRAPSASTGNLLYKGGTGGAGVVNGAPHVYLVFWGSQWGSQATNSQGDVMLSGDFMAMAPHLQEFIKGLGTNGETWSGVMTQYCQGILTDTQSCPSGAPHVAYPSGSVLAGVWVDESSAAPPQPNGHQIGLEAVSAATHFASTTQTANLNAQYVIVSPTGTHPDGFNTPGAQFCAWHDSTGDSTLSGGAVSSPYGQLAFTNLPYLTDAGASCGQGFVNPGPAGALDGVTLVAGHEYAETLTDPYPSSGWIDSAGSENGDKCAWISAGQGASQDITLSTGSFAVQSTWANDYNGGSGGCEISHPIISN
jgi:serine protease